MRLAFVPKTTEFYDLFTRAGQNLLETARLVEKRFAEFPEDNVRQADVKALEHKGDEVTREILELLNTQYVTPFDREDIYELAKAIDDVVDYMENASDLLGLYKVESRLDASLEQCKLLVEVAEHLAGALADLKRLRRADQHVVEVKRLEDEGDSVVRAGIAGLFDDGSDPLMVIRWKDILEALEDAIDSGETAADLVGNIVVKNV
jgi:predicted phosphate transport protein (TIGR00153 family)